MPLYEYENLATGEKFERLVSIDERDNVPEGVRRVISIPNPAIIPGGTFAQRIK